MKVVISVGGRFHAIELADQLNRHGYLERIITTKTWYCKEKIEQQKCKAIILPEIIGSLIRKISPLRERGYYSYVKDNLFDALARRYISSCDIFHCWGNYALASIPTAKKYRAKIVIERGSSHPYFQDEILKEEYQRYGVQVERAHPQIIQKGLQEIELADRVIIPSEFVRRSFIANGVPESKLSMIPYGIDLSQFKKIKKSDKTFRVLFVGNIGIQKGIHYLLEAWKDLNLKNAELVLIGQIENGMKSVLAKYEGRFTYRGHVSHEQLYKEYSNASVFILPSLQEGSALVTYEAMACGLPSIVSENTGSIVRDSIDGFVVPIRSIDAIKEKVLWIYNHQQDAEYMGDEALQYVKDFTWDRYAKGVIEVYNQLLA